MAKLVVKRKVSLINDHSPLDLWVDGENRGALSVVVRKEVPLSGGGHTLQVKNPVFPLRSNTLSVNLESDETAFLSLSLKPAAALYGAGGLLGLFVLVSLGYRLWTVVLLALWVLGVGLFFKECLALKRVHGERRTP